MIVESDRVGEGEGGRMDGREWRLMAGREGVVVRKC